MAMARARRAGGLMSRRARLFIRFFFVCGVFGTLFVKGAGEGHKGALAGAVEGAEIGKELIFLNGRHVGGRRQDASHSQHKFRLCMSSFCQGQA